MQVHSAAAPRKLATESVPENKASLYYAETASCFNTTFSRDVGQIITFS